MVAGKLLLIIAPNPMFAFCFFFRGETVVLINSVYFYFQLRQDEKIGIFLGDYVLAALSGINIALLLLHHVVERIIHFGKAFGEGVILLHSFKELAYLPLFHHLHNAGMLRGSPIGPETRLTCFVLLIFIQKFSRFSDKFLGQFLLSLKQVGHRGAELLVVFDGVVHWSGNDQRCPCFVYENAVHLVNNGIVEFSLHAILAVKFHIVPQIVEAELVIGSIGYVGAVSLLPLLIVKMMKYYSHAQAEECVDGSHPFGVTASKVVINRDHMHPASGEGIEVDWHGGSQGLAFPSFHLGNLALVEHDTANELDVERPHPQGSYRGFPNHGECLRQELIQCSSLVQALAKARSVASQFRITQRTHL